MCLDSIIHIHISVQIQSFLRTQARQNTTLQQKSTKPQQMQWPNYSVISGTLKGVLSSRALGFSSTKFLLKSHLICLGNSHGRMKQAIFLLNNKMAWKSGLFVKLFLEIFPVFIQIGNSKSFFYYFFSVTDRILFKILKHPKHPISLHDRNFWDHEKSELNFRLPMY